MQSGQVNSALKLADLEVVYCGWREVSLILFMSSYRRTAPESARCPQVVIILKTELRASTSLRLPVSDFINANQPVIKIRDLPFGSIFVVSSSFLIFFGG